MATLHIEGVGDVTVDDSFKSLSPADQTKTVDEIIASAHGSHGAGGSHYRGQSTSAVLEAALKDAFPGVRINGAGRSPERNAQVNGAPHSYHLSDEAVDFAPPKGVSIEQVRKAMADRGIPLNEALAHDKGSGFHYHIAWDGRNGNPTVQAKEAPQPTAKREAPAPLAPAAVTKSPSPKPALPKGPQPANVILRHVNSVNDGIADSLGFPIDAVNSALKGVGLPASDMPIGGSESIRALMRKLGMEHNDASYAPQSALERYTQAAARGVGQVALPGAGVEAAAARAGIHKIAPMTAKRILSDVRAGAGAAVGAQAAQDIAPNSTAAQIAGQLVGGVAGAAGPHLAVAGKDAAVQAKTNRFVSKQVAKNPFAAYDSEIVNELGMLKNDRAVTPADPKGRAKLDIKSVNALEARYKARFNDMLNAIDLPDAEKTRLKGAMDQRNSIPQDEVDALRGNPAGDAFADSITKLQRLRALTPETKLRGTISGIASNVAGIAGMMHFGPAGWLAKAPVQYALDKLGGGGSAEAARVHSADRLLKKQAAYQALADKVGPSGQIESQKAFQDLYQNTLDQNAAEAAQAAADKASKPSASDLKSFKADISTGEVSPVELAQSALKKTAAKAAAMVDKSPNKLAAFDDQLNAPVPEAPITARDRRALSTGITDPTVDPRDLADNTPTERSLASRLRARNNAIASLEQAQSGWDAKLADPSTAPQPKPVKVKAEKPPKAPSVIDQGIEQNIAAGIPGTTRTQEAIAEKVGVPVDHMLRGLDAVAEANPGLANDIARIKANYPTQRGAGQVLIPQIKKALTDDGTIADLQAKAAEAQKAVEAKKALAAQAAKAQPVPDDRLPVINDPTPDPTLAQQQQDALNAQNADNVAKGGRMVVDIVGDGSDPSPIGKATASQDGNPSPYTSIRRPKQYEEAKKANKDIMRKHDAAMWSDDSISPQALGAMSGVNDAYIDGSKFKSGEAITNHFNDEVVPSILANGGTQADVDAITPHVYSIADTKPYATDADFEASKMPKRGRPKKN